MYDKNARKLIKMFLKLNPKGSVTEFGKCRKRLQAEIDLIIAEGNQQIIETI